MGEEREYTERERELKARLSQTLVEYAQKHGLTVEEVVATARRMLPPPAKP